MFLPLLLLAALAAACENRGEEAAEPSSAPTSAEPGTAEQAVDSLAAPRITADGIGLARPGMTVGEVRQQLPSDLSLGDLNDRFMVDLVAIPVHTARDTFYHLVFPADEQITDTTHLALVVTDHEHVRTAGGVGPGTSLAEAAQIYGPPTLSYSIYDEMREYASFPALSNTRIRFRVAPSDTALLAGRYTTNAEFNETIVFDESARIGMVFVDLREF